MLGDGGGGSEVVGGVNIFARVYKLYDKVDTRASKVSSVRLLVKNCMNRYICLPACKRRRRCDAAS